VRRKAEAIVLILTVFAANDESWVVGLVDRGEQSVAWFPEYLYNSRRNM